MSAHFSEPRTAAPDPAEQHPRGGAARRVHACLRFTFGLVSCGILFLGWCGIAAVISPFFTAARRRRIGRLGMHRLFRLYLDVLRRLEIVIVDNEALEALRDETSLILAPNHPSMMDVILVVSRLDRVGCIMKAELWGNIFLGAGARMAGFIRNDSPHNMIRQAVHDLERGSQLLIFPEATRTVREPVNPLAAGFALIAKRAKVPVQTILIETDSPYLRKGWPLFRLPPLPIHFRVTLGQRFEPQEDVDVLVGDIETYFIRELGGVGSIGAQSGSRPSARRAA